MNLGIDFKQPSTLRGLIWLVTGIIGTVMIFAGKDVSQLLTLTAAVAGGMGLFVKDNQK